MAQGKQPNGLGPRIELKRQLSIKVYDTENRDVVLAECSYVQVKKPSPPTKMSPRKDQLQVSLPSATPALKTRGSQVRVSTLMDSYQHTTCSSKQKFFAKASDISTKKTTPKETSLVKVCRYTYCTVHSHKHESGTPFKMPVSKGRQLVQDQIGMKVKGPSAFRKIALGKGHEDINTKSTTRIKVVNDFVDEIYAEAHGERSSVEVDKYTISVRGDKCKIDELYPFKCSADDNRQFAEDVKCVQQIKDEADKQDNASMAFQSYDMDFDEDISYPKDVWGSFTIKKYRYDASLSYENEEISTESDNCSHNVNIISKNFDEINEAKEFGSLVHVQLSDSSKGLVEAHQGTEEAGDSKIERYFYDPFYYSSEDERSSKTNYERSENEQHKNTTETGDIPMPLLEDCTEVTDERSTYETLERTSTHDMEEMRKFNRQAPRFLQEELDPEAEKVDLRNQMMDERRAVEEWMIDYALQQAVKRLAPACKTKVQLLVEAFETVIPLPKCDTRLQHTTTGFTQSRTMQACS